MYHDYAISEELFHWQSQNSARPDRGRGLSYGEHQKNGKKLLLFVREAAKDENKKTMAFVNLGFVNLVSHNGSQPMNITWKLATPLPPGLWKQLRNWQFSASYPHNHSSSAVPLILNLTLGIIFHPRCKEEYCSKKCYRQCCGFG